jgi:hypothetical protein
MKPEEPPAEANKKMPVEHDVVGMDEGEALGREDGRGEGDRVGRAEGARVGALLGSIVGLVGSNDGAGDGAEHSPHV